MSQISGDEASLSATSLGQSSKYSIDPGTLLAATNAPTKFSEFQFSFAYEKGLMKVNCGLCRMNFHRDSVFYKVANNRIISLQKSWNFTQIGRRYQTASYLYKSVTVCTFCSQFFYFSPEEIESFQQNSEQDEKHSSTDIVEKQILNVSTALQRSNVAAVAMGHKTFQSSEMDGKSAECAITPPYAVPSKTRREVDPWWEIDFGRGYRIHSISFLIATGIKQDLGLHIILLNRPYGFDDPFLDSIVKKGILYKEYDIPPQESNRMEEVTWKLSTDMQCTGVRIQLKGIHFLALQKFQAFQGDNLVDLSSEDSNGLQLLRENSLMSVGPRELKAFLSEMISPEKKKQMVEEKSRRPPQRSFNEKKVYTLSKTINANHDKLEAWRSRVLEHASIFTPSEIQDLYQVVFKYVADVDSRNKDHPGIVESELLSVGLTQHYPRCDLVEIHTRIRSIVRWYQTRTHLKLLGSLANCVSFEPFSKDPTNYLYALLSCFKRMDYYWNKKEELEKANTALKKRVSNLVRTTVAESRGCSWPQFIIIMSLFCSGQPLKIPKLAFNIDEERVSNPNYLNTNNNGNDNSVNSEEKSVSSHGIKSLEGKTVSTFSLGLAALPHLHNKDGSGHGVREKSPNKWDALAATPMKPFEEFPAENRNKSILEAVRKESTVPPYNSSFTEYKFDKFKRRVILTEIPFPKTLSLDFAKSLIPKRAATSSGRIRKDTPTSQSMENLTSTANSSAYLADCSPGSPISMISRMKSPTMFSDKGGAAGDADDNFSRMSEFSRSHHSFDLQKDPSQLGGRRGGVQFDMDSLPSVNQSAEEFKKGVVDFFRICALCGVKFPRDCMQMQVMRKHIVKLRSSWNPDLISPEIRLLDNTLSMYSLVSVCVFCTQFFDPDYPDGIAYPNRDEVKDKKSRSNIGPIESIMSQQSEAKMDTFYDSRYDNADNGLSGLLKSLECNSSAKRDLETRERARKATEIAMMRRSISMPDKL